MCIDKEFFRPKIRTSRLNMEFVEKATSYAREVIESMEKTHCIKYMYDESGSLKEIIIDLECPLWYVEKPVKVRMNISRSDVS